MFRFASIHSVSTPDRQAPPAAQTQQLHDIVNDFAACLESILTDSPRKVVYVVVPQVASASQREYTGVM